MSTGTGIAVTLDGEVVDAGHPTIYADDPTFLRSDGVFETLLLRGGRVCLVDAHLARLARSAAIIGLPSPDLARWRVAVDVARRRWAGTDEAVMRLVLGRGRGEVPTAFVTVSALPARVPATRRHGVSAVTLDRGVPAFAGAPAPWSVAAAKSLSYAINAAALREAERLGADDVVLVAEDGYVLEGPRSSVVVVDADGVLVTPPETSPILAGTTVKAVFDVAVTHGISCRRRSLRVPELLAAQGVWLLSSVTLAARVHTLDGTRLASDSTIVDMTMLVDEAIAGNG